MFKSKPSAKKINIGKVESPERLNRLVAGAKLTGDLTTDSSLRIDGEIVGNVQCDSRFVLGEEGSIKGDINAMEVELNGVVEGQIHAENLLMLHKTAVVKGNVRTRRLIIEDGAQIDGNIQTGDFPISKNNTPSTSKSIEKTKVKNPKAPDMVY